MKAIIFYTYLPPWRVDVFNEMAKMYDLTIVFIDAEAQGFTYDREQLLSQLINIDTVFLRKGFKIKGKVFRKGIINIIKRIGPQVIFSHEYSPTSILLSILLKRGIFSFKFVITTSDNYQMASSTGLVKSLARRFVLGCADGVIVYSKAVRNFYKEKFPHLNVEICPNIQNPKNLLLNNSSPNLVDSYKTKFGISSKVLLYVGRIEKVKGLDLLVNAFSASQLFDFQLVIVGAGSEKKHLQEQVNKLQIAEQVVFPGEFFGKELYAWYNLADLFVLPSRYEPFGAVVNEALVFGCPVLASKNIGALEYISEGYNGFVFDPENSKEFIEVLQKASTSLRNISKKNLMTVSFDDYVNAFKTVIDDN